MEVLLTVAAVALCLLAAYRFYGGWLSRRVFDLRDANTTPAHTEEDGTDYVPTKKSVVFGHHFTSIAGTGPIVGPAIAVMWGWVPALLWVLFGSVFIGAVHDLGALVVSLRNRGRTIGDVAGLLLGPRVRLLFLCILIMALWIVLAIFGLVIASVLRQYPAAITPVLIQAPLAIVIGLVIHRKGRSIVVPSIVALGVMYLSVFFGDAGVLHDFNLWCAAQPTWVWIAALLVYSGVASVLPVWVLLQPRDYINALQLVSALALLVVGLVATALLGGPTIPVQTDAGVVDHTVQLQWVAPAIDWSSPGAPPLLPVLFITVACGACSGFHCLVGSGTTSKQLSKETDAKPVGYGSMLTEGFLATLVIAACAAGIGLTAVKVDYPMGQTPAHVSEVWPSHEKEFTFLHFSGDHPAPLHAEYFRQTGNGYSRLAHREGMWEPEPNRTSMATYSLNAFDLTESFEFSEGAAFDAQYTSWQSSNSLGNKVGAFVQGAANLLTTLGLPMTTAVALMAVLVASFAATTLDTSCRLQRYVIQELSRTFLPKRKAWECPKCAYDRRSIDGSAVCPECGHAAPEPDTIGKQPKGPWWNPFRWIATPIGATLVAIVSAFALAMGPWPDPYAATRRSMSSLPFGQLTINPVPMTPWGQFQFWLEEGGTGALTLWPLFGATNQLLAGFAFVVILAWLRLKKKPWAFAIAPAAIMLVVPASAMVWQAFIGNEANPSWLSEGRTMLVIVAGATLAMEAWLIAEACAALPRLRAALDGGKDVG